MFLEADPDSIKEVYVSESFFEKGTAREKLDMYYPNEKIYVDSSK